jgi:outer membrane protein OmpA-like peptidoglycan-associated protein
MDTPYGKPAGSVRRFSFVKWGVAGLLVALLLLAWLARPQPAVEAPALGAQAGAAGAEKTAAAAAAATGTTRTAAGRNGVSMSLAIDRSVDGSLKVHGMVADEATRNQWLNEIRVGAQGARVSDELRVGPVSPAAAAWAGQLSGLVAVMRERRLGGLRVEGERVLLKGAVGNEADKAEAEKMIQAQLPPGYRLDNQVTVSSLAADSSSRPPAGTAGAPTAATATSQREPRSSREGAGAGAGADATASDKLAQGSAGRPGAEAAARKPTRAPVSCPREVRSLSQPVYFDTDAAAISAEDRARLLRLGACLGRSRVRIVGHADPRHTEDYNQQLSERRARAVADALVEGGAPSARISAVGAGKAKPPARAVSRQALQRSRRVDIQIR